jgi:hypothetical protein
VNYTTYSESCVILTENKVSTFVLSQSILKRKEMETKKKSPGIAEEPSHPLLKNYKITINDKDYVSMNQFISGKQIKKIGAIINSCSVWFKINSFQTIEIRDNDTLDLNRAGIERFFSQKGE